MSRYIGRWQMSKEGKKIAQINMAIEIAKITIDTYIRANKLHSLVAAVMIEQSKMLLLSRSGALNATPHEHFNSKGKIDKRKVRRYERKQAGSTYMVNESAPLTIEHLKALKDKMCSTEVETYNYSKELIQWRTDAYNGGDS